MTSSKVDSDYEVMQEEHFEALKGKSSKMKGVIPIERAYTKEEFLEMQEYIDRPGGRRKGAANTRGLTPTELRCSKGKLVQKICPRRKLSPLDRLY